MADKHPTPWRLELDEIGPEFTDCPIRDANDNPVVQTDAGCYPPDNETAALIVEAVNAYDRLRKELRAARINAGSEKRWANHYFERAQKAEAERDALNEVRANIIADNDRMRNLVRRLARALADADVVLESYIPAFVSPKPRCDIQGHHSLYGTDITALLAEAREVAGEEP